LPGAVKVHIRIYTWSFILYERLPPEFSVTKAFQLDFRTGSEITELSKNKQRPEEGDERTKAVYSVASLHAKFKASVPPVLQVPA
jgi:hypothetical protein